MTLPPLLEASSLSMWRGERCLFRGLELQARAGVALHVHGPNGCGKTTLLRIVCGLVLPEEGDIRVRGERVSPSDARLRALLAYLGHAEGLKQELSVLENLRFSLALAGAPAREDLGDLLERLGLGAQAALQTRLLSAGQRRRLALARVIATRRPLWILDEPFTALDRSGCELLAGILDEALDRGTGIIFTSHQAAALDATRVHTLELADYAP